ncbi:MAG: peptidyl-tRNA hydrolase [Clostridia bacterium]|nr:peptidyl-tRNA hydrolase [Clostridia bacterium]
MFGFDAVNEFARKNNIEINRNKYNSLYGQGIVENEKIIILKPQTYMNLSGIAVKNFKDFYKLDDSKIIIIHDDIDIAQGKIKVRKTGGAGTHNGMKSVVHELNSTNFYRIRIGIRKTRCRYRVKRFCVKQN